MKIPMEQADEIACVIDNENEGNAECQVRRKIEDYLERRRVKDELGDELEKV